MGIAGFSSHQQIVAKSADKLKQRFHDATGASEVSATITSGLQAGATRKLKVTGLTIGAGQENDLILLDDDVAAEHVSLEFTRSVFGTLAEVAALDGPVTVNGQPCAPGDVLETLTLPLDIRVGQAVVRVDRPAGAPVAPRAAQHDAVDEAPAHNGRKGMRIDPILLVALGALLLVGVGGAIWNLTGSNQRYVVGSNTPSVAATEVAAQVPVTDWLTATRDRVAVLGLDNTLTVTQMPGGLLRTSGIVAPNATAALADYQMWYDSQIGAPTMVWEISRRSGLSRVPDIGMVRTSEPQAVFLATGTIVRLGDILIDEWTLTSVTDTQLGLTRGAEEQTVIYRMGVE